MALIPIRKITRAQVIINPAAGKIEPILPVINAVFTEARVDWDVAVTKKPHDAEEMARKAVKSGVDIVGVYGGDGTVMEVIRGVMGSDTPVAILPGGTANVLATDLGLPWDLKEACALMCGSFPEVRMVDVARFDKEYFILRLGLGFEAEMMKGADRAIKNRFGRLAYVLSTAEALQKVQESEYTITVDGKEHKAKGITCIIANSGNMGLTDLSLSSQVSVSDGLLDVIVVRRVAIGLLGHLIAVIRRKDTENRELVQHWQGKEIRVTADPPQRAQCDGEPLEDRPLQAKVVPNAVKILVPARVDESGGTWRPT